MPKGIAVSRDPAKLSAFATDESGRRGKTPLAIATAASVADIEAIVRWANKKRVGLIPVSSASNPRRRGDTVSDQACVIVDMSGMDRMVHVDSRDAVAIIEPGVTFAALNRLLAPHGLRSYQPLAPRGSKSVLATFLDREPMTVPGKHWDVADPLAAMEVVFGTGDVFRTGGAGLPGTLEENYARGNRQLIAPGPSFTDFGRVIQGSQGTLAIVAWASLLCQRIPAVEVPLFATGDSLDAVIELCYRMLRRRLAGQMFIVNNVQLALLLADDPAEFAALTAALPPWILYVELAASVYFPDEAIAYQRADLQRDADALGVTVTAEAGGVAAASVATRQRAFPETLPHRRAGLAAQEVFALTQLDAVPAQHATVTALAAAHQPTAVYLQPTNQGVSVHSQFTLLDAPERQAALTETAMAAAQAIAERDGFFSRPHYPWAQVAFSRDANIALMLQRAKSIFDPAHVLNPKALGLGGML